MALMIQWFLTGISILPFAVLHRISDVIYFLIFHVFQYRRKVVRANLEKSFPEKSSTEISNIEKQFYQNFCDLIFETIKTCTISREELLSRCRLVTPHVMDEMNAINRNIVGISSHLGNWEWLSVSVSILCQKKVFGVYTPLTNKKLDTWIKKTRERFGLTMITAKQLKEALNTSEPFLIGLLADQAPSQFAKAIEVTFLNQKTYFSPGPGHFNAKYNMAPVWAWARRIGRSQYEWGLEWMPEGLREGPQEQVTRIAEVHKLTEEEAGQAIDIVNRYSNWLESYINKKPPDWLWSHRRWKLRNR